MILQPNEPLCARLSLGTPEEASTSFGPGTVLAPKRKARPGYICIVWIIALSMSLAARAIDRDRRLDQLYHTTWTAKDGAPGHVRALAQTTDGYLWVGSTIGLFRFDGIHWQNFEPPSGRMLPSSSVTSLLATPDGGLWIGFSNGAVSVLKNERLTNYGESDGLPHGFLTEFAVDAKGTIWAADNLGGLIRLDGSRWKRIGAEWGFSSQALSLVQDRKGTLWVGSADGVAFLPIGEHTFHKIKLDSGNVYSLAASSSGAIWMAELHGGIRPVPPVSTAKRFPRANIQLASRALLFDDSGALWITTLGEGLRRIPNPESPNGGRTGTFNNPAERFTEEQGLSSNVVGCILEDREHNIWVGTSLGIDRFRQSPLASIRFPAGSFPFGLTAGAEGTVQVSIGNRRMLQIADGKLNKIPPQPFLLSGFRIPGGFVLSQSYLHETTNRTETPRAIGVVSGSKYHSRVLLRGTIEGFPAYFTRDRGGLLQSFKSDGGYDGNENTLSPILRDSLGRPWASVPARGVFRGEAKGWTSLQSLGGPPDEAASDFIDSFGKAWFGFSGNRIAMVEGDTLKSFSNKDGISVGDVTCIQGRNSNLWIAGPGGLERFDGHSFVPVLPSDRAGFRDIFALVTTESEGIWLASPRGIIQIPESEIQRVEVAGVKEVQYRIFDFTDGLPAQLLGPGTQPTAVLGSDGRIWFATVEGVVWIDPKRIPRNELPPPVHVVSIAAVDRNFISEANIRLRPLTRSLRISYTALSLSVPERIRFRYKLQGQDKDWIDAGASREAVYTNLSPGSYAFHVIACNGDGIWNETGATLNFVILPAYYQTWWFRLIYVLLAAGSIWAFYLYRLKLATAQIRQRLDAQLEERERIARELHDTLLQGFQGLLLRFQAVKKTLPKNESAHQMMEDVLDRADEVLSEGRQRVRDLRVEELRGDSLTQSLTDCGKELSIGRDVEFSLSVVGTPQALNPIACSEAYNIAQEAIYNAFRHSQGSKIDVELTFSRDCLSLRIRDNGRGINEDVLSTERDGHWGLTGMQERAQKIGAQITLWSRPGSGTEVDVSIPSKVAYFQGRRKPVWKSLIQPK